MIHNPLVSIIIPVFNVRPYLVEALDSVIAQSYDNLEIIIIDDGSTDGSGLICDQYAIKDSRIRVIHQKNRGLSSARNVGLDIMRGDVVAFVDSDDAIHPDYVRNMLTAMIRENVDMVLCKCIIHNTTGPMRYKRRERNIPVIEAGKYGHDDTLRSLIAGKINVAVWNKLYRSELWKNVRFPDGHVYEDIDTTFRIINICNDIYVLDLPLYYYRRRPGSITGTITRENISDKDRAYAHYEAFVRDHVPKVFTKVQLNRFSQARLNCMIADYSKSVRSTQKIDDAFQNELSRRAMAYGKNAGIDSFRLRTKVAYYVLSSCPWILQLIFPLYYSIRMAVWKITGR